MEGNFELTNEGWTLDKTEGKDDGVELASVDGVADGMALLGANFGYTDGWNDGTLDWTSDG